LCQLSVLVRLGKLSTMTRDILPDGTWDCHFHVFEDPRQYPLSESRAYTPPLRPIEQYWKIMAPLGVGHAVLVQPSVYGTDNSLLLDQLSHDRHRLRGVAVVSVEISLASLRDLRSRGVRAIRLNPRLPSGLSLADGVALAPKLAQVELHLQVQPAPGDVERLADLLAAVGVPVVLDHAGFPDLSGDGGEHIRETLLRLLEHDRFWLKLAAPYRFRVESDDPRIAAHALALSSERPDRILWGSDWPHPEHVLTEDDTRAIVSGAREWFANESHFRAACCENPAALFQ